MSFFIGSGMVLEQGGKFILVQETRGKVRRGLFSLPGGTLELDEDLIACAKREVQEETGLVVEPERLIAVYQMVMKEEHNNVLFFVFAAKVPPGATFYSEEHEVIRAFSYEEVVAMNAANQLRAPNILQAIDEWRSGHTYPLQVVRPLHLATLPAIVMDKTAKEQN